MLLQRQALLPQTRCSMLQAAVRSQRHSRRALLVRAVGWDPEGILAQPKGGHLRGREIRQQMATDLELQQKANQAREEAQQELQKQREARKAPTNHLEVINYLLETTAEEMEYETVRCRPLLTEDLFNFIGQQIGEERFAKSPNDDKVAELEGLRDYLGNALVRIDEQAKNIAAPRERLTNLLQAKDKRATLLQMAGDNEIDESLLKLLQQNIDAARAANQDQAVLFMEKIRDAAKKFSLNLR